MPDLLVGGLETKGDPFVVLALEGLRDGCVLEDACADPATRDVLERIAIEERSHAELSWAILGWVVERSPAAREATSRELARLGRIARPTAVSAALSPIVARADEAAMRRHGRIPDGEWAAMWSDRVAAARARAARLVGRRDAIAA